MGDSDLYDGEWIWPTGLAHYVEFHTVRLPEEFIKTMARNSWRRPQDNLLQKTETISLKRVGYWWSQSFPDYPHPANLVEPGRAGSDLSRILEYLNLARSPLGDILEILDQVPAEEEWPDDPISEDVTFWLQWAAEHTNTSSAIEQLVQGLKKKAASILMSLSRRSIGLV